MTPRVFDLYEQHRVAVNVWFACMFSELHMGSLESARQDHSGEEWQHFFWFKGSTLTNTMTATFACIPWSICDNAARDVSCDLQWRLPQKVDAFLILSCAESQPEILNFSQAPLSSEEVQSALWAQSLASSTSPLSPSPPPTPSSFLRILPLFPTSEDPLSISSPLPPSRLQRWSSELSYRCLLEFLSPSSVFTV